MAVRAADDRRRLDGVSYGDPAHPNGAAVMGYVVQRKAFIYRDFHADGGYAELSAPGLVDGRWVWTGPYDPGDGSAALGGRVTYTVVDDAHFKRQFEEPQPGGSFKTRAADACVKSTPVALDAAP